MSTAIKFATLAEAEAAGYSPHLPPHDDYRDYRIIFGVTRRMGLECSIRSYSGWNTPRGHTFEWITYRGYLPRMVDVRIGHYPGFWVNRGPVYRDGIDVVAQMWRLSDFAATIAHARTLIDKKMGPPPPSIPAQPTFNDGLPF